jgi:hypothetical protein
MHVVTAIKDAPISNPIIAVATRVQCWVMPQATMKHTITQGETDERGNPQQQDSTEATQSPNSRQATGFSLIRSQRRALQRLQHLFAS